MSKSSLQRYLLLRLGTIIACITVLMVGLMAYVLFYSYDDSAEYYMQYEALTLSEHYAVDDDIVEFDPQIKEYYWRDSQLPDAIQHFIEAEGVVIDKLNWYQNQRFDIYVYPHLMSEQQTFWVVHFLPRDDLGEGFYFSRNLVSLFVLMFVVLLLVAAVVLSMVITKQLQRFSSWVGELKDDDCCAPEFTFVELQQAAYVLANSINAERQSQLEQQQLVTREKALLSTLSHELRTPMAVINTAIALLDKRGDLGQKDQSTLVKLSSANDKMKWLSNTLLSLWRKQTTNISTSSIDVNMAINQAIEAVHQQRALDVSVLVNQQPHDEQQFSVSGDGSLLQLVLDNLLRNAGQYSANGQAQLDVKIEGQQLQSVRVSNLADLQQHKGNTEYGYGLGLYLIAEICQQQGWQMCTENVAGQFVASVTF